MPQRRHPPRRSTSRYMRPTIALLFAALTVLQATLAVDSTPEQLDQTQPRTSVILGSSSPAVREHIQSIIYQAHNNAGAQVLHQPSGSLKTATTELAAKQASLSAGPEDMLMQHARSLKAPVIGDENDPGLGPDTLVKNLIVGLTTPFATTAGDPAADAEGPIYGKGPNLPIDMYGLVLPKGYPLEEHLVITSDGYKLRTFRMKHGRTPNNKPGLPVLLVHGIFLCSAQWVWKPADESLAFLLADAGYDVWMLNHRGTTFGRESTKYSVLQPKFWKFTLDEFFLIDFPDTLAYVLQATGQSKLASTIGNSQGCSDILGALSTFPELNQQVGFVIHFAPVVYLKLGGLARNLLEFTQSGKPFFRYGSRLVGNILFRFPAEFWVSSELLREKLIGTLCRTRFGKPICEDIISLLLGTSKIITYDDYLDTFRLAWPIPISNGIVLHWFQIYSDSRTRFMRYDRGAEYDLTKVTAKTAIFSGQLDELATPAGTDLVIERLRSSGAFFSDTRFPDLVHLDFTWNIEKKTGMYHQAVAMLLEQSPP